MLLPETPTCDGIEIMVVEMQQERCHECFECAVGVNVPNGMESSNKSVQIAISLCLLILELVEWKQSAA